LSKHRSPHPSPNDHRGNRRPLKKRNKTAIVTAIALALSGAAYSAHASFGGDRSHQRIASDVSLTPKAVRGGSPSWPTFWTSHWPTFRPTTATPTTHRPTTSAPTTHRPTTSAPSTTHPTTTKPTTTRPTTSSPTTSTPTSSSPPPSGSARWPGQVPGKFYLGMSCNTVCPQKERALNATYGVHRTFKAWGNWNGIAKEIQADQAAGRLPWVSFKPPGGGPSGWQGIADGKYDSQLKALAEVLKANDSKPVLLTFHHEPSNDGTEAQGKLWAAAYCKIHDVLKAAGALGNVADPPILGDWLFNPRNSQDPKNWLTQGVLQRMPFLGIDLYENASGETFADRIPVIVNWMASQGYPNKMVGIGETGSTDMLKSQTGMTAAQWLNESLSWAAANTDKVGVVSYFNSTANSASNVYWPLDESASKLDVYRTWLNNAKTEN
jgi:hypothetical protein